MASKDDYLVSLVVPCYNEHETIGPFMKAVDEKLASVKDHIEIVFVDDGSKDDTAKQIHELCLKDPRVSLIRLSRNFGKEAGMSAALDLVQGDAMVMMDADLQDPPELVLDFIRCWREEGVDNVYGVRTDRSQDTGAKRVTSGLFYKVFNKLSARVKIPENVGDFRLIDRKIIDTLRDLPERNRFMKGLFAWPGFTSRGIGYKRPERVAGQTKWNYWKLWNFALDGISGFSSLPLRVWSYVGGAVGLFAILYMVFIFIKTMVVGIDVPGYASIMSAILFLGAVQLISIGVLGEYLGRLGEEVKGRPVYVVRSLEGPIASKIRRGVTSTIVGVTCNEGADYEKKNSAGPDEQPRGEDKPSSSDRI